MGGSTDYRTFQELVALPVDQPTPLLLGFRELSARDGSPIDWTRIPVSVYPAGSSACGD